MGSWFSAQGEEIREGRGGIDVNGHLHVVASGSGFGFQVSSFEFRVSGWDFRFRVSGFGFRAWISLFLFSS